MVGIKKIRKVFGQKDFDKYVDTSKDYTLKLDGVGIYAIFKNNNTQYLTKGHRDITKIIKRMSLDDIETFPSFTTGEVILKKKNNKMRARAVGILGKKEPSDEDLREIKLISHHKSPFGLEIEDEIKLTIKPTSYENAKKIFERYKEVGKLPIDGLIMSRKAGEKNSDYNCEIVAIKFDSKAYKAKLKEIKYETGKKGKITPVGIFEEPVETDNGVSYRRITLHNKNFVESNGITDTSDIYFKIKGEIIPVFHCIDDKNF